jgi:predicted transcriptional regulator
VDLVLAGSQKEFPVLEGERLVGILTRDALFEALAKRGREAPVAEVMRRDFMVADPGQMLEVALANLQACECHTLPVVQRERLVGMITMDNVGEFLMLQAALEKQGRGALEQWRATRRSGDAP